MAIDKSALAALVATERHLWLKLSDMKGKDRIFLLDAPLAPSGLFGDTVSTVVERFQEAKKQVAGFHQFLPYRGSVLGAAGQKQPQPSSCSSYRVQQKKSIAFHAPPQRDQGLGRGSWPKSSREMVDLRNVILIWKTLAKKS